PQRLERLARRREQLGPVNPLAQAEYDEALAHVQELERQRTDLETALRELRVLLRDTDRVIRPALGGAVARGGEQLRRAGRDALPRRPRAAASRARGHGAAAGPRRGGRG